MVRSLCEITFRGTPFQSAASSRLNQASLEIILRYLTILIVFLVPYLRLSITFGVSLRTDYSTSDTVGQQIRVNLNAHDLNSSLSYYLMRIIRHQEGRSFQC